MKAIFTISLLIITTLVNAQSLNRIVRQMEKDDFERARELALRSLEDNPQAPGPNLCLAWIAYDNEQFFEAYDYIITFKNNRSSLEEDNRTELMEYLKEEMTHMRKKSFDERIDKKYKDIEEAAINYVREKLNPELATEYIEKFPNSPYIQNTVHIRNHYAYLKAQNKGTVEALQNFIKNYPDAAQQEMAKKDIHQLEFDKAKKQKSLDALNEFIEKYPLAAQRTEALMLRDKLAFEKAKAKNTLEAIDMFIEQYPEALQLAEARKLRQKLVFEKAKEINTIDAYTAFVKEYPFGKYYVDIFNLKAKALGERIGKKCGIANTKRIRAYDYDQTNDRYTASATDKAGNTYIAGIIELDTAPKQDVWLLKINSQGKMIWNKQFGSPADDKINELFVREDGSLLGVGIYGETDTTAGQGWILNVTNEGKKQWMKLLGDIYPLTSMKTGNEIMIGGYHNTDSTRKMRLVRFDNEMDKKFHRNYSTQGSIRAIKKHSAGGQVFCGKNWICHINENGYITYDAMLDSNLVLLDIIEREGNIYAAGVNPAFELFLWNNETETIKQTGQKIKQLQILPQGGLIISDSNNKIMKLNTDGTFSKDMAQKATDFEINNGIMFFTSQGTILQSNIIMAVP